MRISFERLGLKMWVRFLLQSANLNKQPMKTIIYIFTVLLVNTIYGQCDIGTDVSTAEVVWEVDAYEGQGHEEQILWGLAFNKYIKQYDVKSPDSIYYDRHNRVYGLEWRFKDSIVVIEVNKSIIKSIR